MLGETDPGGFCRCVAAFGLWSFSNHDIPHTHNVQEGCCDWPPCVIVGCPTQLRNLRNVEALGDFCHGGWKGIPDVGSGDDCLRTRCRWFRGLNPGSGIREMSERGPRWSWTLLVHQGGSWSPWSTWSSPIRSDPHFWKFYRKGWIRVDQGGPGGPGGP